MYTLQNYVDDLFKVAVGVLGMAPSAFFELSPSHVQLAIEGYNSDKQYSFYLQQTAMVNAIGSFFGGKKFKATIPFKSEQEAKAKPSTVEEKAETLTYLKDRFNKVGEIDDR